MKEETNCCRNAEVDGANEAMNGWGRANVRLGGPGSLLLLLLLLIRRPFETECNLID